MADTGYVEIHCTVCRPRPTGSVWIVLDGGKRSENIPLSSIHPDCLKLIIAEDRVHNRSIRIRRDIAKVKGLDTTRRDDAACDDLFAAEKRAAIERTGEPG